MTVLCVTGHRPDRLGGYTKAVFDRLENTALLMLKHFEPESVITGMAQGWDQAVASACDKLGVPFIAALPFPGQEKTWPEAAQKQYHELLKHAFHVQIVSPAPYRPQKMFLRNQWMVDHSDQCLALWDGEQKGGTFECVRYAMVCGKPIHNAWPVFHHKQEYPDIVSKL